MIYYYGILSGTVSSINDTNMTSPKCGRAATHYLPEAVGLSFFCRPSLKGRYVTIRDLIEEEVNRDSIFVKLKCIQNKEVWHIWIF